MDESEITQYATEDLEMEYFNLREYLKFEYLRAVTPTILFTVAIALHGQLPQTENKEVENWIALLWPYLTTITAFVCAFGIVYFGGRAWRSTKLAIAIQRELQNRGE